MISSAKSLASAAVAVARRWRAKRTAPTLLRCQDPRLAAVGRALIETLDERLTAPERSWVERIEARRETLRNSSATIDVVDFGAGHSDSRRSADEMERGVAGTAQISDLTAAAKSRFWGLLLLKLTRHLQPASCVEMGTSLGLSASYQGAALELNDRGRLRTLEGSPRIADVALETFEHLALTNVVTIDVGPFHQTLLPALEAARPVDYLFNDGHHDHHAVLKYFDEALPFLAHDAVVVLDDISWSAGMRAAWDELKQHPSVVASVDLRAVGLLCLGDASLSRSEFSIPL